MGIVTRYWDALTMCVVKKFICEEFNVTLILTWVFTNASVLANFLLQLTTFPTSYFTSEMPVLDQH